MKDMQRFILGILGIAVVLFAFYNLVLVPNQVVLGDIVAEPTSTAAPAAPQQSAPAPAPETGAPAPATPAQQALAALESVGVTPAIRVPDYDRELFGDSWEDVDGNGCDTRNDILARDLTVTAKDGTCRVLTGVLSDAYTGKTIDFVRGEQTSQAVQIDHIVSLSGAWKSGAYAWPEDQRVAFANDPANLRAVDGPTNNGKSDKGPARWMPSTVGNAGFDCQYATDYTNVLVKYDLTAPAEDLGTLRSTLSLCA